MELFLLSSHGGKGVSTFLQPAKDSNSTKKVFTLFIRSVRKGVSWWQCNR